MWGHVHLNTLDEIKIALETYKRICNEQHVTDFIIINSVGTMMKRLYWSTLFDDFFQIH